MTPRIPLAAAALLLTVGLASCAATPEPDPTPTTTPVAQETAAPVVVEPTPEPEETVAEPTCETIISDGTVSALTELGWTAERSEFRIGEEVVDGGINCSWADWERPSDHGQFFAWGPLPADRASAAQSELLAQGWIRENGDEGVYFTEPDAAFQTDEQGYGMTYLFGDGWVTFADTKQSLILIEWP